MSKRAEANQIMEQRSEVLEEARAITARALEENREITADEQAQRSALHTRAGELKILADQTLELASANSDALDATRPEPDAMEPTSRTRSVPMLAQKGLENMRGLFAGRETGTLAELRALRSQDGADVAWPEHVALRATPEYSAAYYKALFGEALTTEQHELVNAVRQGETFLADDDTRAGVLAPPMSLVAGILKARDAQLPLSSRITKKVVRGASSLGKTRRKTKASTFAWGQETSTPTKDTALDYDRRVLTPQHWSAAIDISRVLLRRGFVAVEDEIIGEVQIDIAEGLEQARITGTGNGQPLGLFTASENGISTARDVVGGSTTAPTYAGMQAVKYAALRYWDRGEYMVSAVAHEDWSTTVDGDGRPLWKESVRAGEPDTFGGRPFSMHELFPSVVGVSNYFGMFAAFEHYWQADDLEMEILRDIDIQRNVLEIVVRGATDAMPMLEEAFVRMKYAAS